MFCCTRPFKGYELFNNCYVHRTFHHRVSFIRNLNTEHVVTGTTV